MATTIKPEVLATYSVEDRLKLIETVWETLLADGVEIPVQDWERELIRECVAEFKRDPNQGTDAFEFLDNLGRDE